MLKNEKSAHLPWLGETGALSVGLVWVVIVTPVRQERWVGSEGGGGGRGGGGTKVAPEGAKTASHKVQRVNS